MAASFARGDWYRDAPKYYDLIFDQGTAQESAFIEQCIERHATARERPRRLLEPACGSGRLLEALARRGFRTDGYDTSEHMLALARERLARLDGGRSSSLTVASMESHRTSPQYLAAYNLVSTFKYVLEEAAAVEHLAHTAASLVPGGIYVLGLHLTDYADRRLQRERWHAQDGKAHVVCNIQSWPACRRSRQERVRSRLVIREPGGSRSLETHWIFRTYSLRQLSQLLASVPLLERVAQYDFCHDIERPRPFDGRQLDMVLILRRREDAP